MIDLSKGVKIGDRYWFYAKGPVNSVLMATAWDDLTVLSDRRYINCELESPSDNYLGIVREYLNYLSYKSRYFIRGSPIGIAIDKAAKNCTSKVFEYMCTLLAQHTWTEKELLSVLELAVDNDWPSFQQCVEQTLQPWKGCVAMHPGHTYEITGSISFTAAVSVYIENRSPVWIPYIGMDLANAITETRMYLRLAHKAIAQIHKIVRQKAQDSGVLVEMLNWSVENHSLLNSLSAVQLTNLLHDQFT